MVVDTSKDPPGPPLLPSTDPLSPLLELEDQEVFPKSQATGSEAGEEDSPSMGQVNSVQTSAQLERLQEQLRASVARSEAGSVRSISIHEDNDEGNDGEKEEYLSMSSRRERSRSTSNDSRLRSQSEGGVKRRTRPASALLPSTSNWTDQLSQIAFPARKSNEDVRPCSISTSSVAGPSSSMSAFDLKVSNPPRRSASSSPSSKFGRRSGKPSPTASLRQSMRLPFLPSIPASPLPPILSPGGMTRSASSPPVLPAIVSTASFSPTLELTPPTAGLSPLPSDDWPTSDASTSSSPPHFARTSTSASAPNLSLLAAAPIVFDSPKPTASSSNVTAEESVPMEQSISGELLTFDPELLIPDSPVVEVSTVRDKSDARTKQDEKRYHALVELVETETAYLEHLRALVKVYFQTLPFLTLLSLSEVEAIVRNAEALLELHERIFDRIELVEQELRWRDEEEGEGEAATFKKQWKVRKAAQKIAKVFVNELPNFHLYNDFCARHSEAMDITRRLSNRPEWEAYERQCALRVATQGDMTPLASRTNSASASPFFSSIPLPPLSTSVPLSSTPSEQTDSPADSPTMSTSALPVSSSVPSSSAPSLANRSRSKLRFSDFAIAPIQRIMRYPMVFGSLAKYCEEGEDSVGSDDENEVKLAYQGLKKVADAVDEAKREREGEIRTRIVANRMEFQSTVSSAFCDILGPTLLVGALHVLHRSAVIEPIRVKYYGCFLYKSHLILAKIKKRASYEPREWLPLRLFEITSLEEGQGLLSQSIRLSYQDHVLELGSLCSSEKAIWLNRLNKAQVEARRQWEAQPLDDAGHPTLFDDTLISSVSPSVSSTAPTTPVRKSHSRSTSSVSVTSVLAAAAASSSSNSPFVPQDEPLPALPTDSALFSHSQPLLSTTSTSSSIPSISNRHRFSTTASSLLGRTPSAQRAAVDLRLADVFSEECLAARAQAAREAIELDEAGRRLRTISGPKRSMTAGLSATSKTMSARDRRRMSSFELEMGRNSIGDLRTGGGGGAIGMDSFAVSLQGDESTPHASHHVSTLTTPERKWANAIRKTKSAGSRSRPALPEIDTALAEAMNQKHRATGEKQAPLTATGGSTSGSWRSKAENLRRVASHSSLDGARRLPIVTTPIAPSKSELSPPVGGGGGGAVDVERNNSVSSTTSSNGTATNSSSSHSHGLHLIETPPSSIPPSPDLCALEIVDSPFVPNPSSSSTSSSLKPSLSTKSANSRWTTHSLQDGVSSVFRMKRRKSTLGLTPFNVDSDHHQGQGERPAPPPHVRSTTSTSSHSGSSQQSNSESSSDTAGAKLSRRSSTIGGYLSKRVQSSPTLTGFFHSALGSASSPHLPLTRTLTSAPSSSVALVSPAHEINSTSTSPSSGSSSAFHTPTSVPGTPEQPSPELHITTTNESKSPTVTAFPTQVQTTPRSSKKHGALASKVGRTVSSTFQNMARSRSSEGGGGSTGSSPGSINSRRFHFSMTPLS
ncbi:uncharacterized protein JCM6883_002143 [Sporobolomyces salmoneus]|uniref:uncharacterized protein n=1 Tax=Sporobolomyces salmoneus TaxID=183962 RepID=UPI00317E5856